MFPLEGLVGTERKERARARNGQAKAPFHSSDAVIKYHRPRTHPGLVREGAGVERAAVRAQGSVSPQGGLWKQMPLRNMTHENRGIKLNPSPQHLII